jgi:hypothetical protein
LKVATVDRPSFYIELLTFVIALKGTHSFICKKPISASLYKEKWLILSMGNPPQMADSRSPFRPQLKVYPHFSQETGSLIFSGNMPPPIE